MALVLADRVRDTTTTTGTGTVTLSGTAPTGYQNFSVIGNANTTYYTINAGSQWEVGIGTYSSTGPTLARTTVLESSNANALVNFSAGTKDVFVTYPSDRAVTTDGVETLTNKTINGSNNTITNVSLTTAVTGTLPVANGGTGVTTSTGTTSVVLSNSPVLVTPTLGAASATSIANGLGAVGTPSYAFTGDLNTGMWSPGTDTVAFSTNGAERMRITSAGNVGIGVSSPAGRLALAGTGSGSTSPEISFENQTATTGRTYAIISGDGGPLRFQDVTAGAERMRIDSSGNIGIGTSSPGAKLDVIGAVRSTGGFSSNSTTAFQPQTIMSNSASDATGGYYIFYKGRAGSTTSLSGDTLGTLLWYGYDTGNTAVATSSIFTLQTAAAGVGSVPTALVFTNGGNTERMRIDSSGNVGIGTTSPVQRLHVRQDQNGTTAALIQNRNGTGSPASALQFISGAFDLSDNRYAMISSAGGSNTTLQFWTGEGAAPAERMRITSAGNVGIGTSSPAAKFQIDQNQAAISYLDYNNTTNGGGVVWRQIVRNIANSGTTSVDIAKLTGGAFLINNNDTNAANFTAFGVGASERMRIDSSGRVGIGTSSPAAKLDVVSGAGTDNIIRSIAGNAAYMVLQGTSFYNFNAVQSYDSASNLQWSVGGGGAANTLAFTTNGANERMRITSGGDVGIGTSSPGKKLDLVGQFRVSSSYRSAEV